MTDNGSNAEGARGAPVPSLRPEQCRRWSAALATAAFVLALGSYLQSAASRGILWAPPANGGDADSYERLGYNLASGLGFGYCPQDAAVVSGESEPPPTDACQPGCTAGEFTSTAYRPPGFPMMVAAIYRISPLNFFAVRVVNCICFALAVALVAVAFARQISVAAGIGAALLCSIDPRMREFAGTFLTENLATLMLSLFALSLVMFLQRQTSWAAGLCGLTFSGLVLVRSFYVAWYPAIWLGVAVVCYRRWRSDALSGGTVARRFLIFALASLLLTGPWWIRNCLMLQAVMPTGTQGGIGIADGFSDSAYENRGDWQPTTATLILEQIRRDPKTRHLSGLALEKEHSRRGSAHALGWIVQHPWKAVQLSWWKLCRLWEAGSLAHSGLFGIALLGWFAARRHPLAQVILVLAVLNSLTVMATYHTYERFLTPFRPLLHGLVGSGLEALVIAIFPGLLAWRFRLK